MWFKLIFARYWPSGSWSADASSWRKRTLTRIHSHIVLRTTDWLLEILCDIIFSKSLHCQALVICTGNNTHLCFSKHTVQNQNSKSRAYLMNIQCMLHDNYSLTAVTQCMLHYSDNTVNAVLSSSGKNHRYCVFLSVNTIKQCKVCEPRLRRWCAAPTGRK